MNPTIKKIIAKEIIIFSASILIIGLIWATYIYTNKYRTRKYHQIEAELETLEKVDKPSELYYSNLFIPIFIYNKPYDSDNRISLYYALKELKFDFISQNPLIISDVAFSSYLFKELNKPNLEENTELIKIYTFLNDKRVFWHDITFKKFIYTIKGSLIPEDQHFLDNLMLKMEKLMKGKEYYTAKIKTKEEVFNSFKNTSLIILLIIYPFRFIVLSLIWAIKTLRVA